MKLTVQGLTKEYRTFSGFVDRLLAAGTLGFYGGSLRVRALRELTLTAGGEDRGEILGIIGPNGSGKSTFLRILAGNSQPTAGSFAFQGSVRSILELGVGFNEELTGIENIYYNGRLWDYDGRVLMKDRDRILDFARVSDFANQPLKAYSTGMQMRLAFALATYRRSDMLLVDEALAVGDASFQQKCIRRFQEFREQGSLILVVSHDTGMLQAVCDRMLLLDRGRCVLHDTPANVMEAYMALIASGSFEVASSGRTLADDEFALEMSDEGGFGRDIYISGERARVVAVFQAADDIEQATVGIHINDGRGIRVFGTNTHLLGERTLALHRGRKTVLEFRLKLNLGPGKYTVGLSVHRGRAHSSDCYLWREALLDFAVEAPAEREFEGLSFLEPEITVR